MGIHCKVGAPNPERSWFSWLTNYGATRVYGDDIAIVHGGCTPTLNCGAPPCSALSVSRGI